MRISFKGLRELLGKFIYILNPQQRKLGVLVFALTIFSSFLQMIGVYVIVPLVSAMTDPDGFMQKWYITSLQDMGVIKGFSGAFIFICLFSVFVYFFKDAVSVFQLWVNNKYSFKIQRELAVTVLGGYMRRIYDFFLNYGTAKIIRDTQKDTAAFNSVVTAIFTILTELFTMIFIVMYIIVQDIKMGVCILILGGICLLLIYKVFRPRMKKAGDVYHDAAVENQKILLQSVEGIKEVQIMRKQDYFVDKYEESYRYQQKPQITMGIGGSAPTYIIEALFFGGLMVFICLRTLFDESYVNNISILASYVMGAIRIMPSLGRISAQVNRILYNKPAVDNLHMVMKDIREYEKNTPVEIKVDQGKNVVFKEMLSLEHISWHYTDTSKNVLTNLDFQVKKGQSVGIIGASGAGKSTLADILLGLHIPQEGSIRLDDVDINDIPFEYSRVIGYVPQSVYLVDGSVRENVAFGVDEEEIDDEKIWQSLKQAQMEDFVKNMDYGLDTIVGERGVKFSGGQRQRLAIARALYREPQILVLDEATSALDNDTEKAVMEAIEGLYGTITMIIIAHRLTTVKMCDVIYEIKDGKAIERSKEEVFG